MYHIDPIKVQNFSGSTFADIPDNSIVISFDDSLIDRGILGKTFTSPDFLSQRNIDSLNKVWIFVLSREELYPGEYSLKEVVAHELGHGFGFRHTSILPSIMERNASFGEGLFSKHDKLYMKVMYSRPVGNRDIDMDAVRAEQLQSQIPKIEVFIDKTDSPVPVKIKQRVETLPGRTHKLLEACDIINV